MVTQNHLIISSQELRKTGGKISRFWNQEIQELKENSEKQNTEKRRSTWLNVCLSWAENKNFETNLLAYEAKQLHENKHMALHDQVVEKTSNSMNCAWYIAPNFPRLTAREIM